MQGMLDKLRKLVLTVDKAVPLILKFTDDSILRSALKEMADVHDKTGCPWEYLILGADMANWDVSSVEDMSNRKSLTRAPSGRSLLLFEPSARQHPPLRTPDDRVVSEFVTKH